MKKNVCLWLTLVLLLSATLVGCGGTDQDGTSTPSGTNTPSQTESNTSSKTDTPSPTDELDPLLDVRGAPLSLHTFGGRILVEDDAFLHGEFRALERYHLNNGQKDTITDKNGIYIHRVDDWIYFIDGDSYKGQMYRIKTDGSDEQLLDDSENTCMSVVNGKIYYASMQATSGATFKCDLDGKNKVQIHDEDIRNITVYGSWIYYVGGMNRLYRMTLDGQNRTLLPNGTDVYQISDGKIYYYSDGLYVMDMDGSNSKKISDAKTNKFCISGNYAYYFANEFHEPEHKNLLRAVDLQSGETVTMLDAECMTGSTSMLLVEDGYAYCQANLDNTWYFVKVKADGSKVIESKIR